MTDIITYLNEMYEITAEDLVLPSDERNFLLGQLSMIKEVEGLILNGIPMSEEDNSD